LQVVKDAIDQICDVLDVQDPIEREEYTLYVITNSGERTCHNVFCRIDGMTTRVCNFAV